jgi:hypothetical protein
MLPTIEEQDKKANILIQENVEDWFELTNIRNAVKEYTKWYAIEVVKHCAEVAKVEDYTQDDGNVLVDKQSILNIINEL